MVRKVKMLVEMDCGDMAFSLEDHVKWSSQAQGKYKTKIGIVVQVVQSGEYPDYDRFPQLYAGAGIGMCRNHESYVVAVDCGKTPGSSTRHYWPRVSALSKA